MSLLAGWDDCGLSGEQWAELSLRLRANVDRRVRRSESSTLPLLDWAKNYLPKHFVRQPSTMHRWLGGQLDLMTTTRGAKLNLIGPRGGAKSTVGSLAYVLRAAVEGWEPYIWIVSDTRQQARLHLANIKAELTRNSLLAEHYPQAVGEGDVWHTAAIRMPHGVVIEAFGTGQRLRGRRSGSHRPTLIVCDDLQNDGHMLSPTERQKSHRWFESSLLKAGNTQTNIMNLATALHRDALALTLHRTPGWTSRVFAAIEHWPDNMSLWHEWERIFCDLQQPDSAARARLFYDEHRPAMDQGAELLWPEEESLYALMSMRVEGGQTAFEREKQGVPINAESCEWPEDYFDEHIWFDDWPVNYQVKIIALDPSKGTDSRHSDYSAFVLLAIDAEGLFYVDAQLARRSTSDMVIEGAELCHTFMPQAFGVESNQFQELLAAELDEEFRRRQIYGIQTWKIDNHVSKLVRIRRLTPLLSKRRLRFKAASPGAQLLVNQLKDFPHGDHDDGPDALEMAVRLAGDLLAPAATDNLGDRLPVGCT